MGCTSAGAKSDGLDGGDSFVELHLNSGSVHGCGKSHSFDDFIFAMPANNILGRSIVTKGSSFE